MEDSHEIDICLLITLSIPITKYRLNGVFNQFLLPIRLSGNVDRVAIE